MGSGTPRLPLTAHRFTVSGRAPEPPEGPHIGGIAKLLEGPLPDLPDALAGDSEQGADLFQGERLGSLFQSGIEGQDLPFAGGEMTLEYPVDELALQANVGHLLDLDATAAGNPLAQRRGA